MKKTIKDVSLDGKKVFVRADFNVPLDDKQQITDDTRIVKTLPTIQYLLDQVHLLEYKLSFVFRNQMAILQSFRLFSYDFPS